MQYRIINEVEIGDFPLENHRIISKRMEIKINKLSHIGFKVAPSGVSINTTERDGQFTTVGTCLMTKKD